MADAPFSLPFFAAALDASRSHVKLPPPSSFPPARRYLHLKLFCPPQILLPSRVLLVWALLRLRHPLLASRVEVRQLDDIYFVCVGRRFAFAFDREVDSLIVLISTFAALARRYELPRTTAEAVLAAKGAASFTEGKTKDGTSDTARPGGFAGSHRTSSSASLIHSLPHSSELVDRYLNGPRTLSPDLLAKVLVSRPPPSLDTPEIFPNPSSPFNAQDPANEHFEFMFFAGHFLGDGVSFAVLANEFMTLCASDMGEEDLSVLVQSEIDARVAAGVRSHSLTLALSSRQSGLTPDSPLLCCRPTRSRSVPRSGSRSPARPGPSRRRSPRSSL